MQPSQTSKPAASAFTWRASGDAAAAHAIHERAIARAPAGMVRPDPLSHFERHTGPDGVLLACLHGGAAMVGYGVLGIESPMAAHLAGLLAADPARFAILDGAAALPEWRGFGLHQAAIGERIACAAARGRTLIGATVSPHNLRAMHSLLRAGFRIHAFASMYGGLDRLLVLRDTLAPAPHGSAALRVAATDCGAHRAALAAGLAGLDMHQEADASWSIGYGPPA